MAGAPRIFLSVGEHSGERIACDLMRELRRHYPEARFCGVGGSLMQREGFELLFDLSSHSIMWFWDVLALIPQMARTILRLQRFLRDERPDAVVAIDSPAFNFHMTRGARRLGIPAIYYVGPQVWAYNPWRVVKIRKMVDRLLVILPFEVDFYAAHGIDAVYVGHPLFDRLGAHRTDRALADRLAAQRTLGILPGSRVNEVRRSLPVMLAVAERLRREMPDLRVVVSEAREKVAAPLRAMVEASPLEAEVLPGATPEILAASRLALCTSGTVTLETSFFEAPAIVLYRLSALTLFVGRPWMTVDRIALPNLIAEEPFLDEYLTSGDPTEEMTACAGAILGDDRRREQVLAGQREVKQKMLRVPEATRRAADEIVRFLQERGGFRSELGGDPGPS